MSEPAQNLPRVTAKEYLELERHSTLRHEFVDGLVYMMAGASRRHNTIALDIRGLLRSRLTSPCVPFALEVKVEVKHADAERYFYPDVIVTCSELDNDAYLVKQPVLIIEVTSDSTRAYDRTDKFESYKRLHSLQEYVLVDQDVERVDLFRKRTGWGHELYAPPDQVELESVQLSLPVQAFY